jgi:hypothetical protein
MAQICIQNKHKGMKLMFFINFSLSFCIKLNYENYFENEYNRLFNLTLKLVKTLTKMAIKGIIISNNCIFIVNQCRRGE